MIVNGRVAAGRGDVIEADGIDDLVVVRSNRTDIYAGGRELTRNLTQTPDATIGETAELVSILDYDGDGVSDVAFSFGVPYGRSLVQIHSGTNLSGSFTGISHADPIYPSYPGTTQIDHAEFITTSIGDINGDGFDDLAMASPDRFRRPDGMNVGVVSLVLGGQGTNRVDFAHAIIHVPALGHSITALGDINHDGYDDFALHRKLEDGSEFNGGLLIYLGQPSFRTDEASVAVSLGGRCVHSRRTAGGRNVGLWDRHRW